MNKKNITHITIGNGNNISNSMIGSVITENDTNKFYEDLNKFENELNFRNEIDLDVKNSILELINYIKETNIKTNKNSIKEQMNSIIVKFGLKIIPVITLMSDFTSIVDFFGIKEKIGL